MKQHTVIYMRFFGYDVSDFIPCECCGNRCVDVYHIDNRGSGGSKTKDFIENLMGLCREHHEEYGDKKEFMEYLQEIHNKFMITHGRQR